MDKPIPKSTILVPLLAFVVVIGVSIDFDLLDASKAIQRPYMAIYTEGFKTLQDNSIIAVSVPHRFNPETLGVMMEIINCESGGQHYDKDGDIKRGEAGEYGIAQYMPGSWEYFNKLRGTNFDIYNERQQINMLEWCLNNNLGEHWTCFPE